MVDLSAEELFAALLKQISNWPEPILQLHGFGLLTGNADPLRQRRRAHARTILAAEQVLETVGGFAGEQPLVLMKGLEIAQLYPSPLDRPFRDVDLLANGSVALWESLLASGYRPLASRRRDIDHHHLPSLKSDSGVLGVDIHTRPNVPSWSGIERVDVISTAQRSRTGIDGLLRPRDDVHALLIALHCWKAGFARLRDIFDAMLLAAVSDVPVEATASRLGLHRTWAATIAVGDHFLIGGRKMNRFNPLTQLADPCRPPHGRTYARVIAPYWVANPVRVTRAHTDDYRLSLAARRPSPESGATQPP